MKMENYSKAIDVAINKIDWDIVKMFYKELESISQRKKVVFRSKTVPEIKRDLKDLIKFAIEGNCKELRHDQWIISWNDNYKNGTFLLDVFFIASKGSAMDELSPEVDDDQLDPDMVEKGVLEEMLAKSVKEENYELSAVIHRRLNKINKSLRKKS